MSQQAVPKAAQTSGVRPDAAGAERKYATCPKCGQLVEVFEGQAYRGSDWFAAHRLPVPMEMRHGPPLRIRCAGSFTSAPRTKARGHRLQATGYRPQVKND
jgi:hypothetical protein